MSYFIYTTMASAFHVMATPTVVVITRNAIERVVLGGVSSATLRELLA